MKTRLKKLAIVTTWYPPLNGTFVEQQARYLAKTWEVHVFVQFWSMKWRSVSSVEHGVHVHRFYIPSLPKRSSGLLRQWINGFARRIVDSESFDTFDVIHAHNYQGACVAHRLYEMCATPYVITFHASVLLNRALPPIYRSYLTESMKKASRCIAVSTRLKEAIQEEVSGADIHVIPNPIDTELFYIEEVDPSPYKYVMVGDWNDNKGGYEVVSTFLSRKSDDQLHIVGVIECKRLKQLLEATSDPRVYVYGVLSHQETAAVVRRCHCLISFSRVETFGIVLVEALAAGLTVLYTPSGGPNEVMPEGVGICIERRVDALSEAMDRIQNHPHDRLRTRNYALEHYAYDFVMKRMMGIYEDILS